MFQKLREFLCLFWPTTLIEWLVVISIGGMFCGIFLNKGQPVREPLRRKECLENMQKILKAIEQYESQHGSMPAVVVDVNGEPLYSWRVLLLPYLDDKKAKEIHKKLHLDEPWDSEYHRTLECPAIYRCPSTICDPFSTSYLLVEDRKANEDGSPHPILLETSAEVPWMQPKDLTMTDFLEGPITRSSSDTATRFNAFHIGAAHAGFSDGTVKRVEDKPLNEEPRE